MECFITIADKKYFEYVDALIESILRYSTYNIIVYSINEPYHCKIKTIYDKKRIINTVIEINNQDNYSYTKPDIFLDAIERFKNIDNFVYLDSDIFLGPEGDKIFNFCKEIDNYPILTQGVSQYPYIYDKLENNQIKIYNEIKLLEYLNIDLSKRTEIYRMANIILFNEKCKEFISEWKNLLGVPELLLDKRNYFPYWDETAINVLFWKYDYYKYIPLCFLNVYNINTLFYFLEFDILSKCIILENEFTGFSLNIQGVGEANQQIIPYDKSQIILFHGKRSYEENIKMMNLLELHANYLKIKDSNLKK